MDFANKGLLVEGWRGINQSYALINQNQLLGIAQIDGLKLFCRDLPFAFDHWRAHDSEAGFSPEDCLILNGLQEPDPDHDVITGIYRICSPFRTGLDTVFSEHRTTTFMITEVGLAPDSFAPGQDRSPFFARNENRIVTSTEWSRNRIIEYGFPEERVHISPLGVDAGIFKPIWPDARARGRSALGVESDETLFLNIGPPLWNKGIDLLLQAFATLRLRGLKVRLLIKDQQKVYGVTLDAIMQTLGKSVPALMLDVVRAGIITVPMNLSPQQLATLFGLADCYVSPYRAEGFNLPVLEAVACGVPTIVTRGGATDDFCNDATSLRIAGKFHRKNSDAGLIGAYIEPDPEALIDAMSAIAAGWRPERQHFDSARQAVMHRFNWQNAARETARLSVL